VADKAGYWLDLCDDNMISAKCLLKGKRYLDAAFFCHLTAEKALKAAVEQNTGETPPKIHKLKMLADKGGVLGRLSEEQLAFLDELEPFNIEARYPEYKATVAQTLNKERMAKIYKETGAFLCWIKKELGR
jgi:HEPN domain-containing protein